MTNAVQELKEKLCAYLKANTVTSIVGEKRNLVMLSETDTVQTCIQKLSQHDVRSAPIKPSVITAETTYVFVDFVDLVAYLIDLSSQNSAETQLTELQKKFMETPITQVANFSKLDSSTTITKTTSVFDAAVELTKGHKRVLLMDNDGNIANMMTHSDVINVFKKFIDDHQGTIPFNTITAQQLNLSGPAPPCVSEEARAIDAFYLMFKDKLGFAPVVSEDKELLSVISARDLKVVGMKNDFSILTLPVLDFIGVTRQASPEDKYPYIWCKSDSSFDMVIKRLKATHVHRLVMINEKKVPVGVISVHNVLSAIVS